MVKACVPYGSLTKESLHTQRREAETGDAQESAEECA